MKEAGGTVNSSRGILCAWKKDAGCTAKVEDGIVAMSDIVEAAAKAAIASKEDLLRF